MNSTAKAQAAGIGAGLGAAITSIIFGIWPQLVGPPWESVISAVVSLALAAWGAWQVRNTLTTEQVVVAAKSGELGTALAGTTGKADATAVAEAITALPVKTNLIAAGAPVEILKPVPVPGGHSSTMKPVPKGKAK